MWFSDFEFDVLAELRDVASPVWADMGVGTDWTAPALPALPSLSAKPAPLFMADDYTNNSATTGRIYFNGMDQDVNTDFAGDSDWLKLTGTAGQTVTFNLDYFTGTGGTYTATLRDAAGTSVAGGTANSNTFSHTFGSSGTYFLDLASTGSSGFFRVWAYDQQDDIAGDTSTTRTIYDGLTVNGVYHDLVGGDYEQDWFKFTLFAGQSINFTADVPTAWNDMQWAIYDASGNALFVDISGQNFAEDTFFNVFTAQTTGTYYVGTYSGAVGRGYSFAAEKFFDDYADGVGGVGGTAQTPYGTLSLYSDSVTGTFEHEGDSDSFLIDVVENTPFVLTLTMDDPNLNGVLMNIYDDNGTLVQSEIITGAPLTLRLGSESSGQYTVNLDAGFNASGGYTLTSRLSDDDYGDTIASAQEIVFGQVMTGRSHYQNDVDMFAVTVSAGQVLRIDAAHEGDTYGWVTEFFDAEGNIYNSGFSTFDGLTQTYQFDLGGTYYFSVQIDDINPSDIDDYAFVVNALPDYAIPAALIDIFPHDFQSWVPLPNVGSTPQVGYSSTQSVFSGALTIAANQTHLISRTTPFVEDALVRLYGDSELVNNGTLWIEAFDFEAAVGVYGDFQTLITNNGTISVLTNNTATGVFEGFLHNFGTINVVGNSEFARGILMSFADTQSFTGGADFLNQGTINVWSMEKAAEGLIARGLYQPVIDNKGIMTIVGYRESVGIDQAGGTVTNSGTLTVFAGGPYASIGIYNAYADFTITNSGIIDAEFAIYTVGTGTFSNSGDVYGNIVMLHEDGSPSLQQTLTNTGNIFGNVFLGDYADTYSSVGGKAYGQVYLGGGDDMASGASYHDFIFGEGGNDTIIGGGGDDVLSGGAGDDTLTGDSGKDTLAGGAGADTLTGGTGVDTFVLEAGSNVDTVTDFVNGTDKIAVGSLAIGFDDLKIFQSGTDVKIAFGSDMLILQNTNLADIDASDFIFRYISTDRGLSGTTDLTDQLDSSLETNRDTIVDALAWIEDDPQLTPPPAPANPGQDSDAISAFYDMLTDLDFSDWYF